MLAQLADDLLHDPETQERTERLKERLLDQPQVVASGVSLWNALRRSLQASLADPDGPLRTRLVAEVTAFAERLVADPALRARFDGLAADAAVFAVERYGAELTAVITHTVDRWDGKEAVAPDRAPGRPRPPVHPDQRHHRRRPGRRADPHRVGADQLRPTMRSTMAPCQSRTT